MAKKPKENSETYICPKCGGIMTHTGGLLDWECSTCGAEGTEEYDAVNKCYYIDVAESYDYKEIYSDPVKNKPRCCKDCDRPYPSCTTSCKIFDD